MNAEKQVTDYFITPHSTIRQAIECIDRSGRISIALVVDDDQRFIDTITDGDVRRGILAGKNLDTQVVELLQIKANTPHPVPITAPVGVGPDHLLALMQERRVKQIPLLDEARRVVDIVILSDLLPQQMSLLPIQALIMAGGEGIRLRPLTEELPKPMLPVGNSPLLELIILELRRCGITRVTISTRYLANKITDYFGDGSALGVHLSYVYEDQPLGTAGVIARIENLMETLLVVNGDVITKLNYRAFLDFHNEQKAYVTIAVRQHSMQIPYGVVECDGPRVSSIVEKPNVHALINGGIYLLQPEAYHLIPKGQKYDMTDLIQVLLTAGLPVANFPITEYWLDIGQHVDYEKVQQDSKLGRFTQ